jgi:hypothetical protein
MPRDPITSREFESYRKASLGSIRPPLGSKRLGERSGIRTKKLNWSVILFCLGLAWPCGIFVGSLRLSFYRIVLLAMILPCLAQFLGGKVRTRLPDAAVLLYAFWRVFSLMEVNGIELSSQTFGIELLETIGPYLLARCYIRNADDFYNTVQLLFRIIVALLPFAFVELVSGKNILRDVFAMICPTTTFQPEYRSGLTRVQSVFDHPILFGVFAASAIPLVHLVLGYKKSSLRRYLMTGATALAASFSLSAGPLMAIVVQMFLLSWNSLLWQIRARWKILICIVTIMAVAIEAVANRSLPSIVSGYLTFEPQSYYFRLLIWDYGSAAALNHPLFGLGLNLKDWERPNWMGPSIDNFWLYLAIRSGLLAPILLQLALLSVFLALAFKKRLDDKIEGYRTALLIILTGLYLVSWTVHFWDTAYVMLFFLMGSGLWMLDKES